MEALLHLENILQCRLTQGVIMIWSDIAWNAWFSNLDLALKYCQACECKAGLETGFL